MLFSAEDRIRLEKLRLQRFAELFPQIKNLHLLIDINSTLHLRSKTAADAELATVLLDSLCWQGYLVLGVQQVAVWQEDRQICRREFDTILPPEQQRLQSIEDFICEAQDMTTAVLEPPRTTQALQTSLPIAPTGGLPGCTLAMIAADTEQEIDAVRAWLREQNATIIPFAGEEIVSGETAILAFNYFAPLLIQRRMAERGLLLPTPQPEPQSASNGATPKTEEPAPGAKALRLPSRYTTLTLRAHKETLNKMLPKDKGLRLQYLEAVVTETAEGKAWLSRVASAYTAKFKGDEQRNYTTLLGRARDLFAEARTQSDVNS